MENTYWNRKGKYQEAYDSLVESMPVMDKCDTLAGELVRAASRLGYDFYNNGMGNNTSGALHFLDHHSAIDRETFTTIYEYTRGRIYNGQYDGDNLQRAIETMVDQTVGMIVHNPQLMTIDNTEDMFDFEEEEQNFCEECGDEVDRSCGWLCSYCEEAQHEDEEEYA